MSEQPVELGWRWRRFLATVAGVTAAGVGLVGLGEKAVALYKSVPALKAEVDDDFFFHHEAAEELQEKIGVLERQVEELMKINMIDPADIPGVTP